MSPDITIHDNDGAWVDGRRIGTVTRGTNGEWYLIPLSKEAWADPLEGIDNIKGTGHSTPENAVKCYLSYR